MINAAPAGGTILVPAGTWRIDSEVMLHAGKKLLGMGQDATVFYRHPTTYPGFYGVMVRVTGADPYTEVADIGWSGRRGGGTGQTVNYNTLLQFEDSQQIRVRDCYFQYAQFSGIRCNGFGGLHPTGVIHDCIFMENYRYHPSHQGSGYGASVYGNGLPSWQSALIWGSDDGITVEDCWFRGERHAIASNFGSRYTARKNRVDGHKKVSMLDAHWASYASAPNPAIGARKVEAYCNEFVGPITDDAGATVYNAPCIGLRGGSAAIWGNTATGIHRTLTGFDIDNASVTQYRAGSYPMPQQVQDVHVWGNAVSGGPHVVEGPAYLIETSDNPPLEVEYWQPGRDFFATPPPGYTPLVYPHPLRGLPPEPLTVPAFVPPTPAAFTITATAQANGTIFPAIGPGGAVVPIGGSLTVIAIPNAGYQIDRILVNGINVGPLASWTFVEGAYRPALTSAGWVHGKFGGNQTFVAKFKVV